MKSELDLELAAVAERLRAATVRVYDFRERGSGSGIVWPTAGTIVTNAHVVRGPHATVEFADGRRERAELRKRDATLDLAALRVAGELAVPALDTRDAASLRPGEVLVAVGNPFGLSGALTAGTLQRRNAKWVIADVRLAPGNSGGPLADAAGRVVGINSMVARGLALAVPTEAIVAFLKTIATRPLGISVTPLTLSLAGRPLRALLVTAVADGSRAERGGLQLGDAIVATEGGPLQELDDPAAALPCAERLLIRRAGVALTIVLPKDEAARQAA